MGNDLLLNKIRKLYDWINKNHIDEAAILAIPNVGSSLHEVIYAAKNEDEQNRKLEKLNVQQREWMTAEIERLLTPPAAPSASIVAVGRSNGEFIYTLSQDVEWGQKNMVAEAYQQNGGGGFNFTARLLTAGYNVFPVISVGDDHSGISIQNELLTLAGRNGASAEVISFISSKDFFVPGVQTAFTTIIIQGSRRTNLSQRGGEDPMCLKSQIWKRMDQIEQTSSVKTGLIRISHISKGRNSDNAGANGIIKDLINKYHHQSLIIWNPGMSQIEAGIKYWENEIPNVDIVQINLKEAKKFFAVDGLSTKLVDMIAWFRKLNVTVVITLSRYGSVASYKEGDDGIIFAWPFELDNFVDPTGAGDAFSAGIASQIYTKKDFSFPDFQVAINTGRLWASYACTTLGGAGDCPNIQRLEQFRKSIISKKAFEPMEVFRPDSADHSLRLIDKAYE